jgi:hypothetical protein
VVRGRWLKLIPKAGIEEMRKLEAERIADLRQRIWSELAGRPDAANPAKTIRLNPTVFVALVSQAIKLSRHEARLFGLDAPTKQQISTAPATFAQPVSDEELERQWDRLTSDEQDAFMILLQKLRGRWVEPRGIETTVVSVEPLSG